MRFIDNGIQVGNRWQLATRVGIAEGDVQIIDPRKVEIVGRTTFHILGQQVANHPQIGRCFISDYGRRRGYGIAAAFLFTAGYTQQQE